MRVPSRQRRGRSGRAHLIHARCQVIGHAHVEVDEVAVGLVRHALQELHHSPSEAEAAVRGGHGDGRDVSAGRK